MKNLAKQFTFLLLAATLVLFSGCSASKKAASANTSAGSSQSYSAFVGTWAFDVKGTPDGDTKGDMIISLNGNAIKGVISTGGAQTEIQELKVMNNLLTGIFYYNGMAINMSGTFTGNAYEGKVEAQGYTFPMIATKK